VPLGGRVAVGRFIGEKSMSDLPRVDSSKQRENIILTVQTPLGFFTLIVLVVEIILGLLAAKAEGTDFTILISSMVGLLFLLALIVAYLSYKRPEVLVSGSKKRANGTRGTEYDDFLNALLPDNIINAIEHEARHHNLDHIRIACAHTVWSCRPSRAKPILEDAIRDYAESVREHARALLGKFYY
jgi:hypothetical protein